MEDLELMMSQRVEASTRLSYSPSRAEHPQTESPFFAKLPLEIRVLIYKDIIASWGWHSDAVHIIAQNQLELPPIAPWEISTTTPTQNSRLTCTPCAAVFGDPFLISGTHYGGWPKGHLACSRIASWRQDELHTLEAQYHIEKFRPLKAQVGVPRLEAFLTCQRMYEETSYILYSSLHFSVIGLSTAENFFNSVNPANLNQIRSLHLSWQLVTFDAGNISSNIQAIIGVCGSLSKMGNLSSLHVDIFGDEWQRFPEQNLLYMFSRVKVVPGGTFAIKLPSHHNIDREDLCNANQELPFSVERREVGAAGPQANTWTPPQPGPAQVQGQQSMNGSLHRRPRDFLFATFFRTCLYSVDSYVHKIRHGFRGRRPSAHIEE